MAQTAYVSVVGIEAEQGGAANCTFDVTVVWSGDHLSGPQSTTAVVARHSNPSTINDAVKQSAIDLAAAQGITLDPGNCYYSDFILN